MKYLIYALLFFATMSVYAQSSRPGFRFGPQAIQEKQERRYQNIWTLADWFEQKRKIMLMDQWLALNSSYNPYEFFIGGDYVDYESVSEVNQVEAEPKNFESYRAMAGAYASIIGIQAQYMHSEDNFYQYEGSVHLRLLGRGIQNTNLTGFYGVRYKVLEDKTVTPNLEEKFRNPFAGGSLSLYITKYFGIEGLYKHYFEYKSDNGNTLDGFRYEGTFFIDFSFIRPYATYFREEENYTTTTQKTETSREGIMAGLKIFF